VRGRDQRSDACQPANLRRHRLSGVRWDLSGRSDLSSIFAHVVRVRKHGWHRRDVDVRCRLRVRRPHDRLRWRTMRQDLPAPHQHPILRQRGHRDLLRRVRRTLRHGNRQSRVLLRHFVFRASVRRRRRPLPRRANVQRNTEGVSVADFVAHSGTRPPMPSFRRGSSRSPSRAHARDGGSRRRPP